MKIGHKFDARFSFTITSNESPVLTKDMLERVRKSVQDALNEPKVIGKIKQRFELSSPSEVRCEVDAVFVESKK